jgi:hypothetical protein
MSCKREPEKGKREPKKKKELDIRALSLFLLSLSLSLTLSLSLFSLSVSLSAVEHAVADTLALSERMLYETSAMLMSLFSLLRQHT